MYKRLSTPDEGMPVPETPTCIFAKVDLPDVEKMAALFREQVFLHTPAVFRVDELPQWNAATESEREECRRLIRHFYAALEEAWENE